MAHFFGPDLFAAVPPHHNPIGPRKEVVTGAISGLNSSDGTAFALIHEPSVCIVSIVSLLGETEDHQLFTHRFDGSMLGQGFGEYEVTRVVQVHSMGAPNTNKC